MRRCTPRDRPGRGLGECVRGSVGLLVLAGALAIGAGALWLGVRFEDDARRALDASGYPWHTDVVAATFWIGEEFDPDAPDGSQMISTYDSDWYESYGGCDGVVRDGVCGTEERYAEDGYWPTNMTPRQNPFYLDLPYDDVHDERGFMWRGDVIPWADDPEYAQHLHDPGFSLMKGRWVEIRHAWRTCYGQIADAGPAEYHDAAYVFGRDDARPATSEFNGAGMDVSPALNACLDLEGLEDLVSRVDWRFVEAEDVSDGPWSILVNDDPWVR